MGCVDRVRLGMRWLRWIVRAACLRGLALQVWARDGLGLEGECISIGQRLCRGRLITFVAVWRDASIVGEWRLEGEGVDPAQERAWQAVLLEAALLNGQEMTGAIAAK